MQSSQKTRSCPQGGGNPKWSRVNPGWNQILHIPRALPKSMKASAPSQPQEEQLGSQFPSPTHPALAQNSLHALLAPHSLSLISRHLANVELTLNTPLEMSFSPFNSWEGTKAGRWAALSLRRMKYKCQRVSGISGVQQLKGHQSKGDCVGR